MVYSIKTQSLTKRFGNYTAVDKINVEVRQGEIFGFLGANGAGKTTAIRMLCGLIEPTSGSGTVAGFDIMKQTSLIRTRIGYMSQKFNLYNDLTVNENLRFYGSLYKLKHDLLIERIDQRTQFLEMKNLLNRKTGTLPWGWQQRLSLACATLHNPEILFLDEPTGSVDPVSRKNFWDFIQTMAQHGTTVFVTTHHLDEAEFCDRISIMITGRIAAVNTPSTLKANLGCSNLKDAFLKLVESAAP